MPFRYECKTHPDWTADHLASAMDHLDADHLVSDTWMQMRDNGIITCKVITQEEAHDRKRWRTFGCRTCGRSVTVAFDSTSPPYCETCQAESIMEKHGA